LWKCEAREQTTTQFAATVDVPPLCVGELYKRLNFRHSRPLKGVLRPCDPLKQKEYQKIKERTEKMFDGLMENIGEDGRDRAVRTANRFLELAEQKALPMYRCEDGTYLYPI